MKAGLQNIPYHMVELYKRHNILLWQCKVMVEKSEEYEFVYISIARTASRLFLERDRMGILRGWEK